MDYSERFDDLVSFTDTYKLLFAPYVRLHNPVIYAQLYDTNLCKAIVNVYPSWDEQLEGIVEGIVYLVFDSSKIQDKDMSLLRRMYFDNECVTRIDVPSPTGVENTVDNKFIILAIQLPSEIVEKFIKGNYSEMFSKEDLEENVDGFLSLKYGIPYQLTESTSINLAKEFHILVKSEKYEKVLAAKLGVPYDQFKGKLRELKPNIDFETEELNVDLLIKQLKR